LIAYIASLAKFLYKLGLKRYPPTKEIIQLAASSDPIIRSKALGYFFENFHRHYADFDIGQYADVPFIPTRQKGTPHLAKPKEVRAASGCQLYHVLMPFRCLSMQIGLHLDSMLSMPTLGMTP
jgi:hypothetical protein